MNGKDIFLGMKYVGDDLIELAEYGRFPTAAEKEKQKKTARPTIRRPLLIAALIAMLLLLVGCAVAYVLSIQDMKVGEQQEIYQDFSADGREYLGEKTVTQQVLTLAGIKGSPSYQAAQEWFDFKQEYDPDHSIIVSLMSEGNVPDYPIEYSAYNIYSQEMKDKLDEIVDKYDLKLIGGPVSFRTTKLLCKALGMEDILVPGSEATMRINSAGYRECGNLTLDFDINVPGEKDTPAEETQCSLYYRKKDCFTEEVIGLNEISDWKEWNYTTKSGADVLILRSSSDWRGWIICDMPEYTATLRIEAIDEVYTSDEAGNTIVQRTEMTDRQIELLTDAIDFSIEPKLVEGYESLDDGAVGSGEKIDGYSIELKSAVTDGQIAYITLGITAPEGVTLIDSDISDYMLTHGNTWGFFEPVTEGLNKTGGSNGWCEDDGDGLSNTLNYVLEVTPDCENGQMPFAPGNVWNLYWEDIYSSYWDEENIKQQENLIAEGTWSFDVVFEGKPIGELELIREPVTVKAVYGWDLDGNDVSKETRITSFLLRSLSATVFCDMENAAPDFLTNRERCIYVVLKDGSRISLHSESASPGKQNLTADCPIALDQVEYVLLADGTRLTVSAEGENP